MRQGLTALFAFAVLTPIMLSAWLSLRSAARLDSELRERSDTRLQTVLGERRGMIEALLSNYEADLDAILLNLPLEARSRRLIVKELPIIATVIKIDAQTGDIIHPSVFDSTTPEELTFLRSTQELWDSRPGPAQPEDARRTGDSYWTSFFWGHGLQLIRWRIDDDGNYVGLHLRRARVIADVISLLPHQDDAVEGELADSFQFTGASGEVVYSWGPTLEDNATETPSTTCAMPSPLAAWRLEGRAASGFASSRLPATLLVVASLVAAVWAAILFLRKSTLEMREAEQRVTFVNQVSHELKTPLTNLRLYADLLKDRLPADRPDLDRFARVLVSEGERLTRLVHNVLTFGRGQNYAYVVHRAEVIPDDVVAQIVERFTPALANRGLVPVLDLNAREPRLLDADVLSQAIGNLLSNAEKYAPNSSLLIRTRSGDGWFMVEVEDSGPGVNQQDSRQIFTPFVRGSNSHTEGVSGAGIGLALTRDLARAHGGDLTLEPREIGACFRLRLTTEGGS